MSKLSLVVSQENVLNFSEEEKFLSTQDEQNNNLNYFKDTLNPQKCSVEELLFVLRNSLHQLKHSQSQVSFLTEEMLILIKKS